MDDLISEKAAEVLNGKILFLNGRGPSIYSIVIEYLMERIQLRCHSNQSMSLYNLYLPIAFIMLHFVPQFEVVICVYFCLSISIFYATRDWCWWQQLP